MNFAIATNWSNPVFFFVVNVAAKVTAVLVFGLVVQQILARRRAALASAAGNACLIGLLVVPVSALVLPTLKIACLSAETAGDAATRSHRRRPIRDRLTLTHRWGALPRSMTDRRMCTAPKPRVARPAGGESFRATPPAASVPPTPVSASAPGPGDRLVQPRTDRLRDRHRRLDCAFAGLAGGGKATSGRQPARCRRSLVAITRSDAGGGWESTVVSVWHGRRTSGPGGPGLVAADDRAAGIAVGSGPERSCRCDLPARAVARAAGRLCRGTCSCGSSRRSTGRTRSSGCWAELLPRCANGPATTCAFTSWAVRRRIVRPCWRWPGGLSHRASPALGLAMARPSRLRRRLARIDESRGEARCLPSLPSAGDRRLRQRRRPSLWARSGSPGPRHRRGPVERHGTEGRRVAATSRRLRPGVPPPGRRRRYAKAGGRRRRPRLDRASATSGERPMPRAGSISFIPPGRRTAISPSTSGAKAGRCSGTVGTSIPNKPIPDGATIELQPGETLGGIVQDEQGRPIGGATCSSGATTTRRKTLTSCFSTCEPSRAPTAAGEPRAHRRRPVNCWGSASIHPDYLSIRDYGDKEIIPRIADLRAGKAVTVMKKGVPIEGRVVDADGKPVAGARVLSMEHERAMFIELKRFAVSPTPTAVFAPARSSRDDGFSWPAPPGTVREISV